MPERYKKWDVTEYLRMPQDACGYLEACLQESPGDAVLLRAALGKISQAKAMGRLTLESKPGDQALLQALAETGNLSYATITEIARTLGMQLRITAYPSDTRRFWLMDCPPSPPGVIGFPHPAAAPILSAHPLPARQKGWRDRKPRNY